MVGHRHLLRLGPHALAAHPQGPPPHRGPKPGHAHAIARTTTRKADVERDDEKADVERAAAAADTQDEAKLAMAADAQDKHKTPTADKDVKRAADETADVLKDMINEVSLTTMARVPPLARPGRSQ